MVKGYIKIFVNHGWGLVEAAECTHSLSAVLPPACSVLQPHSQNQSDNSQLLNYTAQLRSVLHSLHRARNRQFAGGQIGWQLPIILPYPCSTSEWTTFSLFYVICFTLLITELVCPHSQIAAGHECRPADCHTSSLPMFQVKGQKRDRYDMDSQNWD